MQLVIAEKPSVGRDLARVLGVRGSSRHALEGGDRVITWCIGHLVELEEPAAYDPRWKSWRMDTLPMLPAAFKLRPVSGTRDQLKMVCGLLRERRFSEVVNACDAGREGELIFRYVYELAGSRLPVRRLWISSLTDEAIRQGFAGLRPGTAYDPLADAARCRSEADWLVGMNATRAVTIQFRGGSSGREATGSPAPAGGAGQFGRRGGRPGSMPPVYSIGRVQTPTLALLVRREQAIRAFQPRGFWEVRGTFVSETATVPAPEGQGDAGHSFTALWTVPAGDEKGHVTRFALRALADDLLARLGQHGGASAPNGPMVERLTEKQTREPPPQLFDLTSLQRTANRRFGFSATRTLEAAQALYERHKVLTYPRTDSRHLPQDLVGELPKLFGAMAKLPTYAAFAEPLLSRDLGSATRSRRIFDAAKVHDHHAIIPTAKVPAAGALGPDEQRVYDLVVRRFLGAFHPDAEFALTEVVIGVGAPGPAAPAPKSSTAASRPQERAAGSRDPAAPQDETMLTSLPPPPDRFVARGRVRLVAGWQTVAGFDEQKPTPTAAKARPGRGAAAVGQDHPGGAEREADAEATLPRLLKGQRLNGRFEALSRQTRPPPRHTEATLLGAMESAGREMEDEALRAAMKDTGLGTPATRAATIETLVKRGFIARDGKQIVATATGISLIERLPVATLASPELTGTWEARLVRIARGQETRAAFMTDIADYVREVLAAVRGGRHETAPAAAVDHRPAPAKPVSAPVKARAAAPVKTTAALPVVAAKSDPAALKTALGCPRCRQGTLMAGKRGWGCSRWREGCPFVIWFDVAGKRITPTQLRDLIEKGKTRRFKAQIGGGDGAGGGSQPAAPVAGKSGGGDGPVSGWLVLDLAATREQGGARFNPG